MNTAKLTVAELIRDKEQTLQLECLIEGDLQREIRSATISSPGLVLAGYTARFPAGRLQVLGETEIDFLSSLDPVERRTRLDRFLALEMPVLLITKAQTPPEELLDSARAHRTAVLVSKLKTGDVYRRLKPYLEGHFAESTTVHGSLADVYGIGLLFVGRSGIGKSECVLDLVERGHRLVADDLVLVSRRGNDVLIGRGHERQHHHMEIRGIGIIDIGALFGIRSIRQQKRIEVVVQLVDWNDGAPVERTGLETQQTEMLGVSIPRVVVPLNPGKNITVISEVVAMNHLLKYAGVDSAQAFNAGLQQAMRVRTYLEEDYE